MNKMEIWDVYNKEFQLIEGVTLVRGQSIPSGTYHLVCDILVRHKDGSYLVMQRDPRKHHGLMWEATAGGSALRGETPIECAVRELFEETGVVAENIREVGRTTERQSHYVEFLCETDCPKDSIVLQEGETVAYRWVSKDELLAMGSKCLLTERMELFLDELKKSPR